MCFMQAESSENLKITRQNWAVFPCLVDVSAYETETFPVETENETETLAFEKRDARHTNTVSRPRHVSRHPTLTNTLEETSFCKPKWLTIRERKTLQFQQIYPKRNWSLDILWGTTNYWNVWSFGCFRFGKLLWHLSNLQIKKQTNIMLKLQGQHLFHFYQHIHEINDKQKYN